MTDDGLEPAAWIYYGTGTVAVESGTGVRTLEPVKERPSNSTEPLVRESDALDWFRDLLEELKDKIGHKTCQEEVDELIQESHLGRKSE